MADSRKYVFRASYDGHAQITGLFDFIQPAAIAVWNLRWQVQGYLANVPKASSDDLSSRFALGSGIRGGSLKRVFVDHPWSEQQEMLASITLINVIAAFEDVTAGLARLGGGSSRKQADVAKALQFPQRPGGGRDRSTAYGELGPASSAMQAAFDWDHKVSGRYAGSNVDNLLVCYRYFKEIRNSIAHNGGRATANALTAYTAFSAIATTAALGGVAEVPEHSPIFAVGEPVKLSFRGTIGFADIVLRIIATYDVDLSSMRIAEREFRERFPSTLGGIWNRAVKEEKRLKQLRTKLSTYNLPDLVLTEAFQKFLRDEQIVPAYA